MVEEFFPGSFLGAKVGYILNIMERTVWGSNNYVGPPDLAKKALEFLVRTKKDGSMKCHWIP